MVSFAGLTRRSQAKTKDFANRGIDIVVTLVLGIVLTFVWFLMGTKLLGGKGALNEGNLPSNSHASPYCCKGSKGGFWGYGFPYNLGDNPAVFSFIPCAIKIIPLNWLRTLFYFKPWLAGTTKGSWSTQRGIMLTIASYMPTHSGGSMKGGGFLGNVVTKFKTRGRDTAAFMKNKGIGAADFVKKKTNNNYKKKYDITFISQLNAEYLLKKNQNTFDNFLTGEIEKILKLLSSYVIKKNLSCLIQLRSSKSNSKIEKEFIKSFFKDYEKLYFKEKNDPFTAFYSILESNLTISSFSQLSYEAIILHRKTLTVPLKMFDYYRMYPSKFGSYASIWDWHILNYDYEEFNKKIDEIMSLDTKKYLEETSKKSNYIIKENSKLKEKILQLIN